MITPCLGVAPYLIRNPVAHCWSEPEKHHKRKFCSVCRKRLDETSAVHCLSEYFWQHYNLQNEPNIDICFSSNSLRVLCPRRVSGLCDPRLQGECHVRAGQGAGPRQTPAPLARGQSAAVVQVRPLQEGMLVLRMPYG